MTSGSLFFISNPTESLNRAKLTSTLGADSTP